MRPTRVTTFRKNVISECCHIDQNSIDFPWTQKQWSELSPKDYDLYVNDYEFIKSFALYKCSVENKQAHLLKIATRKEHRGTGSGSELLRMAMNDLLKRGMQSCILEVDEGNKKAQKFYDNHGFEVIHTVKKFYSNGRDALVMLKKFTM